MPDRACLTGILFVPGPGAQWALLPQGTGCGAGMTCWRRLRDWQHARVWDALHQAFLDRPGEAGQSDWRRACIDPAWLNRFRRLTVRDKRRADIHQAFTTPGCCLMCFRTLQNAGS